MSAPESVSISVVIPVKNEAKKIRACIEGILSQTIPVKEIVVVDSGSTDGTLDILKEYEKVKVVEIPGSEFNHGLTRNLGVQNATGDYVLLTVGDARAYDDHWIEHLLAGFNDGVVAVCGAQVVPHEKDKNPADWFRPYSQPKVTTFSYSKDEFASLSPTEKRRACSWDDVTAMYKREVMIEIPFRFTTYAEDALWARDALLAGYKIAYNPAARVYHYHLEDAEFSFKRNYTVLYHMYKFFGVKYEAKQYGLMDYLRLANLLRKAEGISAAAKLRWWKYNLDSHKGFVKASKAISAAMEKGEEFLDEEHQRLCGKPPIPLKD